MPRIKHAFYRNAPELGAYDGSMREFAEDDLHRAERCVREAKRQVAQHHMAIGWFEDLGDIEEAQLSRLYLAICEQRLEQAREGLRQLQVQRARASFRIVRN